MANLPDLDTTGVSFIAYWNAIDQGGVGSVDPTEVLSSSNVVSATVYDNGVEGVYSMARRNCNFRVKTDGWFVTWIDRTTTFGSGIDLNVQGPWDVVRWDSIADVTQNELERSINDLKDQLSTSPGYSPSSVGLYNYEHPTASTLTAIGVSTSNSNPNYGAQYTAATDRKWMIGAGDMYDGHASESCSVSFAGHTYASSPNNASGDRYYFARDILAQGDMPNPDTEYTGGINLGALNGTMNASFNVMLLWA